MKERTRQILWVTLATIAGIMTALGGCGSMNLAYDGDIDCKGKVALTITGNLQIGAGYGGGGSNAATFVGDCGEGFRLTRSRRSGDAVTPGAIDQPTAAPPK